MPTIQCGSVKFHNIQAVLFDKDGTLADSQDFLRNLGQKRARMIDAQIPGVQDPLLMAFGLDGNSLNPAGLLAVGSRLENEIAAAAYVAETGQDWLKSLGIVRSAFAETDRMMKRKADSTPMFEGAMNVLQALVAAGVKVGMLSADTTENVQDFIACYELDSLVEVGIGVDKGPSKPDPAIFYQACEMLGVEVRNVLAIGDSTADIEMSQAAKSAGCVGVTWGWTVSTNLIRADALINSFNEVKVFDNDKS